MALEPLNTSINFLPMGKNATKRKVRGKGAATSSPIVDLTSKEDAIRENTIATLKLTKAKEAKNVKVLYKILKEETSTISEDQHK